MEERQVGKEEAQQILTYALDLGERMLKRGAEVGRVEDTITRILTSQGAERVDVFTITNSIVVSCVWVGGNPPLGALTLQLPCPSTTNSILDMLSRDPNAGLLRFTEALLVSLALAWGFALPTLFG